VKILIVERCVALEELMIERLDLTPPLDLHGNPSGAYGMLKLPLRSIFT
jgi:hypothetical protein